MPHAILPVIIKATLYRKDEAVGIVVDKVLTDLWPEDILMRERSRWIVEDLKPWTDKEALLSLHLGSQFRLDYLMNPKALGRES